MGLSRREDRWGTSGFSVIEIVVASVTIGMLATLLMPALGSYQAQVNLKIWTDRFAADAREVQQLAVSQNITTTIEVHPVATGEGWDVVQGDRVLWSNGPFPVGLHEIGRCLRTLFTPQGTVAWGASECQPPVATILCLDNHQGLNSINYQVQVTAATAQVMVVRGTGVCL